MATTQDFVNWICGPRLMPKYLYWSLRAMRPELDRLMMGSTHQTIYMPDLLALKTPLPPLPTQRAIAAFLDRKTAALDELMQAKKALRALLAEKRTALINRAVTRGLNPDAALKHSGIAWLGRIPEHWSLTESRYLVHWARPIMYGIVLPGPHVADGVLIIKASNCRDGALNPAKMKRTAREIAAKNRRSALRPGDIVFSIRGSYGEAAQIPPELEGANLTQDAARLSPGTGVHGRWLLYVARSEVFRGYLTPRVVGATVRGINIYDLSRVPVPLPPLNEQLAISRYLDDETARLDEARDLLRQQIELLKEYRQALITAAVTGQVDVSTEAP